MIFRAMSGNDIKAGEASRVRQVKQPVLSCLDPFLLLYGVSRPWEVIAIASNRPREGVPDPSRVQVKMCEAAHGRKKSEGRRCVGWAIS
jgi:hypothetical protein